MKLMVLGDIHIATALAARLPEVEVLTEKDVYLSPTERGREIDEHMVRYFASVDFAKLEDRMAVIMGRQQYGRIVIDSLSFFDEVPAAMPPGLQGYIDAVIDGKHLVEIKAARDIPMPVKKHVALGKGAPKSKGDRHKNKRYRWS